LWRIDLNGTRNFHGPIDANLYRYRIVKGWPDKTGKLPADGNTVDVANATSTNSRSAPTPRRSGIPRGSEAGVFFIDEVEKNLHAVAILPPRT
jgi:hypothetical protein